MIRGQTLFFLAHETAIGEKYILDHICYLSFNLPILPLSHSLGLAWDIGKNIIYAVVTVYPCNCGKIAQVSFD